MDGGGCDVSTVILAPCSNAPKMSVNKVPGRQDNVVYRQRDSLACRRIVVKVKRKGAVDIDNIKCEEIRRTALSNLNNAAQAFVKFSKKGESNTAKVIIRSTLNHPIHHSTRFNASHGTIPAQGTTTAKKHGDGTAMTTARPLSDKSGRYSIATSVSHQLQQKKDVPEFKSAFQDGSLRQTPIGTRAVARAQQKYIYIQTSTGAQHGSVAIPKECHAADVNVPQTLENGHKGKTEDFERVSNPSIHLPSASSSESQRAIAVNIRAENTAPTNDIIIRINDYDAECARDPCHVSEYAADIFNYFKEREQKFRTSDCMGRQPSINAGMRAELIDWMALAQENLELTLETLYLAVKLVDLTLEKLSIKKENLQLLGAGAIFLAAKFEERAAPAADDLVYLSDNAFTRAHLLRSEWAIYRAVDYDLSIPLSYHFIRRYARCANIPMPVLTLARFILETSLMNYALINASDSKMAAACLFMALRMTHHIGWNAALAFYSGYAYSDFAAIIPTINVYLHEQRADMTKHVTIRKKYSQSAFFKVAQVPLMTTEKLIENADSPISTAAAAAAAAAQTTIQQHAIP